MGRSSVTTVTVRVVKTERGGGWTSGGVASRSACHRSSSWPELVLWVASAVPAVPAEATALNFLS